MMRVKSELLGEFAKAADLPSPVPGRFVSIRQSLLTWEPGAPRTLGVPVAVTTPPAVAAAFETPTPPGALGMGPSTWSVSYPNPSQEFSRQT